MSASAASGEDRTLATMSDVEKARIQANKYFPEFNLQDKVVIVTGGGRGLGLTMAEALFQGGSHVHCLDRLEEPHEDFVGVQTRTDVELGGSLHYHSIDVRDTSALQDLIKRISDQHHRLDGLIAAAGILQVTAAIDYEAEDIRRMLDVNYIALFMSAQAVAREMQKYQAGGSIVLIASMSGIVANKGMSSPVYNSSKAAVNQLTKNLAQEWGKYGIRVNSICPGHILTPMVEEFFEKEPSTQRLWEGESMLGRISKSKEYRGAAVYLLSDASSYQTGSNMVIDGGHTAW